MSRGYAEGPATEERLAAMEGDSESGPLRAPVRHAVYGCTDDDPQHFLGWVGDVDPDPLFDSGAA